MYIEKLIYNYIRPSNKPEEEVKGPRLVAKVSMLLLDVVILIIALVVSWDCNSKITGFIKFINVLYAALFPSVYLVFYLFYRIILGNACY